MVYCKLAQRIIQKSSWRELLEEFRVGEAPRDPFSVGTTLVVLCLLCLLSKITLFLFLSFVPLTLKAAHSKIFYRTVTFLKCIE